MNKRRELIAAIGASAFTVSLKAFAQRRDSLPVVGVLTLAIEDRTEALREGLRKLGYVDGRNIRLETPDAGDRYERLVEIANEFIRLNVDVIVAMGSTASMTASKATSVIPIVLVSGVDPVKEKLAVSLSHPGGNVTGVSTVLQELSPKRLELAKEAVAGLRKVGVLWNPDSRSSARSLAATRDAAKGLNLQLQVVEAHSAGELDKAFETFSKAGIVIFVLQNSSVFAANRKRILELATKNRMAGVFASKEWADTGALFSYGTTSSDSYRQAAVFVDKILKGAKPGDLAIEQPTKFELVVNMKTAKALGIKIPNSILVRADKVIE